MRVVAKRKFEEAKIKYPTCASALDDTYKALVKAKPASDTELRKVFKSLDNFQPVDRWYVIDIGGNKLRLIAFIEFVGGSLFVKHIVPHAEYDKLTKKYRSSKSKR